MEITRSEKNIELLRRAYEAMGNGDLDAAAELLTEKFIVNLPGLPDPVYGREIWRAGAQAMLDGFPDLRIQIEDIFGVDDRVAVRIRLSGTHQGPFQGVPATHRQVSFTSIEIYRIEGDKIVEEWVSPDIFGLMQQISGPAGS